MRTLAIGDIHGCLTAFRALLALVKPTPEDLIVTLGDYVDRGPDSRGVIDTLLEMSKTHNLVCLRGNHDMMMLDAWRGEGRRMWLSCGGKQTLLSYGVPFPESCEMDSIPDRHRVFLQHDCRDWYETGRHIFVHACVYPDLPMAEQPAHMLHWEKLIEPFVHCSGKIVICGHSKQIEGVPLDWDTVVCIDTGVYDSRGWLTCLDVNSGRYWQANQRGQTREGILGHDQD